MNADFQDSIPPKILFGVYLRKSAPLDIKKGRAISGRAFPKIHARYPSFGPIYLPSTRTK